MSPPHFSGLQREVLRLYKDFMREIGKKPVSSQESLRAYVRDTFKERAKHSTREIKQIEYWVKLGRRQLETFKGSESFSMVQPKQTGNKPRDHNSLYNVATSQQSDAPT